MRPVGGVVMQHMDGQSLKLIGLSLDIFGFHNQGATKQALRIRGLTSGVTISL